MLGYLFKYKALGEDLEDKTFFIERIKRNAFAFRHPFTGAKEGGWGWSDLPGSVPDAMILPVRWSLCMS